MREPGVIVYISGEDLPPPLPETRFGVGFYIFAEKGPYKPFFTNIRNKNKAYKNINSVADLEISYLMTDTSMFCMLFPNLGIRPAVGFMTLNDSTVNDLETANYLTSLASGVRQTTEKGRIIFSIPTWLEGPPKRMYLLDYAVIDPTPNIQKIIRIGLNGISYYNVDYSLSNFTNLATLYSSLMAQDQIQDVIRIVGHVASSTRWIVWLYDVGSSSNVVIYKKTYGGGNRHQLAVYSDSNNFSISSLELEFSHNSGTSIVDLLALSPTNINFDVDNAVYISGSLHSIETEIDETTTTTPTGSVTTYELKVKDGNTTMEYDLHYSPLESGYYGFINTNLIEIFKVGDVYSDLSDNPTTKFLLFCDADNYGLETDKPFFHERHEGRIPVRLFQSSYDIYGNFYLYDNSGATPISIGVPPTGMPYASTPSMIVFGGWIYYLNNQDIYENWVQGMHDSLLYREEDVQRFTFSPLEVDIISDYGAKYGIFFTKFLRKHDKFMFKVCGTPPLFSVPFAYRKTYTENYWRVIGDLLGFHAIRLQGHSMTGISPTSIYIKAVNAYGYSPIFGINASLNVNEIDHEFILSHREDLLDRNVNTMVKDRVLSLWYFNNNLTEESRRDESPLGEDQNARAAIRLAKLLASFVERYIGEPNNSLTREKVTNQVSQFISDFLLSNKTNIVDYRVICDETNNTPADIANNRLNIRVEARFSKSIKYIVVFERVIMST